MGATPAEPSLSLVERYALAPAEIERRSLGFVAAEVAGRFPDPGELAVAARVLYAAGDLELAGAVHFSPGAVERGVAALRTGAPLVADVRMLIAGLDRTR